MTANIVPPSALPFPEPSLTDLQTRLREATSLFYLLANDESMQHQHSEAAFLGERLLREANELSETIGAWSGESGRSHLDGIRMQAERVVKARDELRAGFTDLRAPEFPIGLLGELLEQIGRLGRWLHPEAVDDAIQPERQPPDMTEPAHEV